MNYIEKVYKNIGINIRKIRTKKRFSIKKLAIMSDISTGYLYKIENGKCFMSLDTLLNIADALEINVTELLQD